MVFIIFFGDEYLKLSMVFRGPYTVVRDRAGFFGKNQHQAKMVKNGPKT